VGACTSDGSVSTVGSTTVTAAAAGGAEREATAAPPGCDVAAAGVAGVLAEPLARPALRHRQPATNAASAARTASPAAPANSPANALSDNAMPDGPELPGAGPAVARTAAGTFTANDVVLKATELADRPHDSATVDCKNGCSSCAGGIAAMELANTCTAVSFTPARRSANGCTTVETLNPSVACS